MTGTRILYVVGAGRSGSTLLDIALGSLDGHLGLGELIRTMDHRYGSDDRCACRAPPSDCPFWSAVFERAAALLPTWNPDAWRRALRAGPIRAAHLPAADRLLSDRAARELMRDHHAALVQAAAEIGSSSGAAIETVVDSSKNAAMGRLLADDPDADIRFVHLVRDGRAVLRSRARPLARDPERGVQREIPGHSALRSTLAWLNANRTAEALCRASDRPWTLLRYEDFCADPVRAWERCCEQLELPRPPDIARLAGAVTPGHQIAGNRLRLSGETRVRAPEPIELSARDALLFRGLAGRVQARWGYGSRSDAEVPS